MRMACELWTELENLINLSGRERNAAIGAITKRFIVPERGTRRAAATWVALRKLVFDPLAQNERELGDRVTPPYPLFSYDPCPVLLSTVPAAFLPRCSPHPSSLRPSIPLTLPLCALIFRHELCGRLTAQVSTSILSKRCSSSSSSSRMSCERSEDKREAWRHPAPRPAAHPTCKKALSCWAMRASDHRSLPPEVQEVGNLMMDQCQRRRALL